MGPVMGEHIMLGMDGPKHRRYRALVSTAFRPKAMERWESELADGIITALIDKFAERGRAELVREFTFPYPTQIIAGILGLPREDYKQFQRWSIDILSFLSRQEEAIAASQQVKEYVATILDDRRRQPRDDLISDLAQAEIDGEHLSDEEIFSFVRLLLPAGVETTYRSTGNLLLTLLSDEDQLEAVRSDRSLIPEAIEEALRYETPLLNITRLATKDTEIDGVPVPAGSTIMLMLAAANREETRYPDPDRFQLGREDPKPHISFGTRAPSVPRHASGPHGDPGGVEPPLRPSARPATRPRRRRPPHPGPGLPIADGDPGALRLAPAYRWSNSYSPRVPNSLARCAGRDL